MSTRGAVSPLLQKLDASLTKHLRLACLPLSVRMIPRSSTSDDALPERSIQPLKDMRQKIAICQSFSFSRRFGYTMVVGEKDISCPLALTAFGFKPVTNAFSCGSMCANMYTKDEETGKKTEDEVAKFSFQQYKYLMSSPIGRTTFAPDCYVVYGNSAQVMRLLSAYLFTKGGFVTSRFSGRLDCADICIETMQKKAGQVILPWYVRCSLCLMSRSYFSFNF